MSTIRQEQVQHLLIREISQMLLRDLRDPRLGFVTVTGAEISRDLRYAKVFVSVLGDDKQKKDSLAALQSAAGKIRGEFGRRARMRVAPDITFKYDEGIDHGIRMFGLLKDLEPELKANENGPKESSDSDKPRQ